MKRDDESISPSELRGRRFLQVDGSRSSVISRDVVDEVVALHVEQALADVAANIRLVTIKTEPLSAALSHLRRGEAAERTHSRRVGSCWRVLRAPQDRSRARRVWEGRQPLALRRTVAPLRGRGRWNGHAALERPSQVHGRL